MQNIDRVHIFSIDLDPVHMELDGYLFNYVLRSHETHETGQIRALQKKVRSHFLRDQSQILTNPCEHRNQSLSGLICTVENWNELDNDMKQGLSNKLTRSIVVLKITTKM